MHSQLKHYGAVLKYSVSSIPQSDPLSHGIHQLEMIIAM